MLLAQSAEPEERRTTVWRLEGLQTGFCVQLLLDPSKLDPQMTGGARPARADAVADLHPALRNVIATQPEFASWSPSTLCLYYVSTVDAGPFKVSGSNPAKAPLIGAWSVAATEGKGTRHVALTAFTNYGRLQRAAGLEKLELKRIRSEVDSVMDEEAPEPLRIGTRFRIRLGKAHLIWDGRLTDDSTRAAGPASSEWLVPGSGRRTVARVSLSPDWTRAMVGSLRVEGKGDFAEALKASPIRFVGPAFTGGGGEFAFGR